MTLIVGCDSLKCYECDTTEDKQCPSEGSTCHAMLFCTKIYYQLPSIGISHFHCIIAACCAVPTATVLVDLYATLVYISTDSSVCLCLHVLVVEVDKVDVGLLYVDD